jgi:radical SAM protein with 4Fe4S-binding SPASM domain
MISPFTDPVAVQYHPVDRVSAYSSLKAENVRLLLEDAREGRVHFRGRPDVLMLNHIDICNLRCIMCPRHDTVGRTRLSRDILRRIVEDLFPTARKVGLAAAQAEPLIADFDYLVEQATHYGVYLDVVTNATLLSIDRYRSSRTALDHLDISLDCHVPEVYERIRLGASHQKVWDNLEAIRGERLLHPDDVLLSASAVVMRSNLPHLPGLVREAKRLGFDAIVFKNLHHDVRPNPDEDPLTDPGLDRVVEVFGECEAAAREVGINMTHGVCALNGGLPMPHVLVAPYRVPRGGPILGSLCWYVLQNFHVMPSGDVFPCIVPTSYSLGNLHDRSPLEIWNGDRSRALRQHHFDRTGTPFCRPCGEARLH